MPKPKSKEELKTQSQKNYKKLTDLVNSYSKEELKKEFSEGKLNRNVSDVLAHLHEWHIMLLGWYKVGMQGEKPDMPAKGFTWKTLPELNREINAKYKGSELDEIQKLMNYLAAELTRYQNKVSCCL